MKKIKEMSLGELAAYVCTHLQKNDIHCVLTGGACVSIYTENRYKSYDSDFSVSGFTSDCDVIFEWFDHLLEMSEVVFKISVHQDLSGLIQDADLTASWVDVDAGIVVGMNVTVTHKRPSYFISMIMG